MSDYLSNINAYVRNAYNSLKNVVYAPKPNNNYLNMPSYIKQLAAPTPVTRASYQVPSGCGYKPFR